MAFVATAMPLLLLLLLPRPWLACLWGLDFSGGQYIFTLRLTLSIACASNVILIFLYKFLVLSVVIFFRINLSSFVWEFKLSESIA